MLAGFVSASQAQTTAAAVTTGTAQNKDNGNVVQLPTLEVRGVRILPPPDRSWSYSRYQNFEVLSDMSSWGTRSFIRNFGQYMNVMNTIFPQTKLNTMLPLKIILCGNWATFTQFGGQWGNPMVVYRNFEQIVFVVYTDYDWRDDNRNAKIKVVTLPDEWDYDTGLLVSEPDAQQNYNAMDATANTSMDGKSPYGGIAALLMPRITNAPLVGISPDKLGNNAGAGLANAGADLTNSSAGPAPRYTLKSDNEVVNADDGYSFSGFPSDRVDMSLRLMQDRLTSFYFENFKAQGMPAWYESALRQIWGKMNIWKKDVFVARDVSLITWMNHRTPLPMERIFEDRQLGGRPVSRWSNPWNWDIQCYAFVHYCLYKHRTKLREGFVKFLAAACRGPVDETIFKQCFNMSYKDMENALWGYSNYTDYDAPWYKFIDDPWPKDVIVRQATEAEVGRIKGETFALAGNKFAAQQELLAPYIRKNTDPQLLGALGLLLLANENPEKARKVLEAAFEGGDTRARVCIALANLRMASALMEEKKLHGEDAKLTADEVNAVMRPLNIALQQKPVLSAAYLLLADVWKNSAAAPTTEQFNVLFAGVRVFPYNMELIYRITNLMADNGRRAEAAGIAEQGLRLSRSSQDKRRFAALQEELSEER